MFACVEGVGIYRRENGRWCIPCVNVSAVTWQFNGSHKLYAFSFPGLEDLRVIHERTLNRCLVGESQLLYILPSV